MSVNGEGASCRLCCDIGRFMVEACRSKERKLRRYAFAVGLSAFLLPSAASSAEIFDDWRDGDLVAQNRPGSREASLWSAAGSRYNHIGIVRLTGGGPYVLDLTESASEVPIEDFIARGTGTGYAIYRVIGLPYSSGAGAAKAAWKNSDDLRDDFLVSNAAHLTDTGLVHRAFKAVGIQLGRLSRIGALGVPRARLTNLISKDWRDNPACLSISVRLGSCLKKIMDIKIVSMNSILNAKNISEIYIYPVNGQ